MTPLEKLLKDLRPVKTKYELIRFGGDNDGGYLVPNDLDGITACFSPGVADNATFEKDLLERGILSHLADASVDGPPNGIEVASFEKKFLGGVKDEDHITLDQWTNRCGGFLGDWILQMDIEGSEYETILAAHMHTIRRFRIIVMEMHNVEQWFSPITWGCIKVFFDKLLDFFHVVHLHPNNNCSFLLADEIPLPTTFEITLLRKDRSPDLGFVTSFPHPLDQPNVADKPDRPLPKSMYGE